MMRYAAVNGLVHGDAEKFRHCKESRRTLTAEARIEAVF
jgi:hypothetical protein